MDLQTCLRAFADLGVTRAYVKHLAPNDNSKNQIFLGRDFSALNIIPIGKITAVASGKGGRQVFRAPVKLFWLNNEGAATPAPKAQIILYPQYPEVRLSGFLRGCRTAPSGLLRARLSGRVLLLGVTSSRTVIAHAAAANSRLARDAPPPPSRGEGVLVPIGLRKAAGPPDDRALLLQEFRRIHAAGWIESKRLDSAGNVLPCHSRNCGGFTLEAELGIRPNSDAEPDFAGWEVKQITVASFDRPTGAITLMTPEPDDGFYRRKGVEAFIRTFGYDDRRGRADRLNFGGVHISNKRCALTGLTLELQGFDPASGKIMQPDGGVCLISVDGVVAAKWHYSKLMKHWNRKHARAAYAMSMLRRSPSQQYAFGPEIRLGQGTDFLRFLSALADGTVYYDPGIKLEGASSASPQIKRRSQFRIHATNLSHLYRDFEIVRLD